MHSRCTVKSRPGLNRPLGVEQGGQFLGVVAGDVQADDADASRGGRWTIKQDATAFFQPYESRNIEIARFIAVGQRLRLNVLVAPRSRASLPERKKPILNCRRDVKQTGPERAEQSLVTRRG